MRYIATARMSEPARDPRASDDEATDSEAEASDWEGLGEDPPISAMPVVDRSAEGQRQLRIVKSDRTTGGRSYVYQNSKDIQPSLGEFIDSYLDMRGFQPSLVSGIVEAYDQSTVCDDFVKILCAKGMVEHEVRWIWKWIRI